MRRSRERRENGLFCITLELRLSEVDAFVRCGRLKPEERASPPAIKNAVYSVLENWVCSTTPFRATTKPGTALRARPPEREWLGPANVSSLRTAPRLDLNRLVRQGLMQGGPLVFGALTFGPCGVGGAAYKAFFVLILSAETQGLLTLNLGALTQKIDLVAEPRHFGGRQWYARCPILGRRASVLWMPPGATRFASRQAWGRTVAYRSQFEAWQNRAATQAQNIRFRLGGEAFLPIRDDLVPPRPRYMHRRTYEAQLRRLEVYERKCNSYLGLD